MRQGWNGIVLVGGYLTWLLEDHEQRKVVSSDVKYWERERNVSGVKDGLDMMCYYVAVERSGGDMIWYKLRKVWWGWGEDEMWVGMGGDKLFFNQKI